MKVFFGDYEFGLDVFPQTGLKEYKNKGKTEVQFRRSLTGTDVTSVPGYCGYTEILDFSTGQIIVAFSPGELVRRSSQFVQDVSMLPISEEDEELIDNLIARRSKNRRIQPLKRRLK